MARIIGTLAMITMLGTATAADDRVKLAKAYLACNISAALQLSPGAEDPGVLADEALARCEDQANRLAVVLDSRTLLDLRAIVRDANVASIEAARMGLGDPLFAIEPPTLRCASCGPVKGDRLTAWRPYRQ